MRKNVNDLGPTTFDAMLRNRSYFAQIEVPDFGIPTILGAFGAFCAFCVERLPWSSVRPERLRGAAAGEIEVAVADAAGHVVFAGELQKIDRRAACPGRHAHRRADRPFDAEGEAHVD